MGRIRRQESTKAHRASAKTTRQGEDHQDPGHHGDQGDRQEGLHHREEEVARGQEQRQGDRHRRQEDRGERGRGGHRRRVEGRRLIRPMGSSRCSDRERGPRRYERRGLRHARWLRCERSEASKPRLRRAGRCSPPCARHRVSRLRRQSAFAPQPAVSPRAPSHLNQQWLARQLPAAVRLVGCRTCSRSRGSSCSRCSSSCWR